MPGPGFMEERILRDSTELSVTGYLNKDCFTRDLAAFILILLSVACYQLSE